MDDLVIERPCLEIIQYSEVIERVQIINGLVPDNITRAMNGEHVGTYIIANNRNRQTFKFAGNRHSERDRTRWEIGFTRWLSLKPL